LALVGVSIVIILSEKAGEAGGKWLSTGPLAGAPFNNPLGVDTRKTGNSKSMVKFKAQTWQLLVHVVLTSLEYKTLNELTENGIVDFFTHPHQMILVQAKNPPLLEQLYMVQLAIWFVTGVFQVFFFEKNRDHLVMLAHHIATIGLLGLSYHHDYMRLGLVILYIHDITDIVVDLLKLANCLKLEGRSGFFIVEGLFVSNLWAWL